MYKIIASILVVIAILVTLYISQDSSGVTHKSDDGGIKLNLVTKENPNEIC